MFFKKVIKKWYKNYYNRNIKVTFIITNKKFLNIKYLLLSNIVVI
jgi:hypothetical protein